MPASDKREGRGGRGLLTVVFWAGVALAPLAVFVLLLGEGAGAMRVGTVLAVLAVVLIGLSITFRRDAETVRQEFEETLLDEIDLLRDDLRQDIGTAARATHRQFGEKLQAVYEAVESLRAQVHTGIGGSGPPHGVVGVAHPHAGVAQPYPGPPHGHVGTAGVVRHTETVQVTTRHTVVDPNGNAPGRGTVYGGTVYGGARPAEPSALERLRREQSREQSRDSSEESWTEQRLRERLGALRLSEHREPESRGSHARDAESRGAHAREDEGHGPYALDSDERGAHSDERGAHSRDGDGWTERGEVRPTEGRWGRGYDRDDDPASDDHWSGLRAGDRWASVRSDDRGRELRVGERRAAVRSDESGTEMRIEDRWAAIRREESQRRGPEDRWTEDRWAEDRWTDDRWSADRWAEDRWTDERRPENRWSSLLDDTEPADGRADRLALPAPSSEPSWSRGRGDNGEGRRRRRDDDEGPYGWQPDLEEPAPTGYGWQRPLDFELSDDRWR
jgi:hypothetical protein